MEHEDHLHAAAKYFNLGHIENSSPIESGIGNKTFKVITDKGTYILRVLVSQKKEFIANEDAVQKQLKAHHIRASEFITTPSYEFQYKGITITCSTYIPGTHPSGVDIEISRKLGSLLAAFHVSVTSLPVPYKGWFHREIIEESLRAHTDSKIVKEAQTIYKKVDYVSTLNVPRGIIHGDFRMANTLITESCTIALLDFEEASENPLIYDVGYALCGELREIRLKKVFLEGYESVRPLTDQEKKILPDVSRYTGIATVGWLLNKNREDFAREQLEVVKKIV